MSYYYSRVHQTPRVTPADGRYYLVSGVEPGRKKRRTMSVAARAAISRAQKARWAKLKAGGKKK